MKKPISLKIQILVMFLLFPILSLGSNPSSSDRLKKAAEKRKLQDQNKMTVETKNLNYDKESTKSESSKKHGKHKH